MTGETRRPATSPPQAGNPVPSPTEDKDLGASPYWAIEAKGILRAELDRRNVTYRTLAKLMRERKLLETERSLANKVSRGSFSFVFFLQVMRVLGVSTVHLNATEKVRGVVYSGEPESLKQRDPSMHSG